ncbi:hypothetical protein NUU61_009526 [Penicillium alfredii]|uniref:Carrier domain-containing protein n=1 Tax=Penicillium alfredii TaxID=1506179 RepID=A0A9W9JXS1_9EURO|nr:uncharacterized protein NUU61_009526 [Penicillium alfredii]KAJ5084947.1 hypothetical protein NUU61_009526 [Penicillium alfredii]
MAGDPASASEPIAIVGSSCRFPGDATTPSKLWELLREPRDVLTEIPESRFNTKAFYHPDGLHHGTTNVRHSYLLSDDHRLFDAQFFGTKPVEANSIDPQQRLLLETVYEGLESAGIPMERLQGSNTGVYVGLMTNDYADLLGRDIQNFPTYFASGTARSILSNRISYFFDWHGPSMTIDTACSSSLIALHQAVQSLRCGETAVAVAAGTNLLLGPEQYVAESKLKMLSPTGRSRMWDKDANGYARGDGIAAVVLKPLSAALADGDHVECLIRETGTNQDGRTKGITMPNPVAQADLIRTTYAKAGLDLSNPTDRPQYFEAHGTGTPAGDPVEAEAISAAFFGPTAKYHRQIDREPPLYVGSIKTVIGHTEGTAGLAAVLKASLALQHGVIPPNLLLNELSPTVRPFYNDLEIAKVAKEWPQLQKGTPRRASVNSFGFGGANAHAILEAFEADTQDTRRISRTTGIFSPFNFSAASEKSLLANIATYSAYLRTQVDTSLHDLAWTLNCRRSTLPVRLSISASSVEELVTKLDQATESSAGIALATQTSSVRQPRLLGVFTGQGAQWARMGAELLVSSSLATECIARLDASLQALPEEHRPLWFLREEILKDASTSRIGQAAFSQPLCTAIQILLVELLRAANIHFTAVVGHSSGEIAAAYAAGYLSAKDAIRIAYYRGWSLQYANDQGVKGAMMAVGTSFDDAKELCQMGSLENRICVAASNSSASVTLSGDADAIEEAKEIFEDEKKFARLLKVDKAYHSHHMIPCSAPYIDAIRKCGVKVQPRTDDSPTWISSVYSEDIENVNDSLTDTYWSNNMVNPVLFSQAVAYAVGAAGPFDMTIEVGPHPALKGPAIQTIEEVAGNTLPYSGTLNRGKNDREAFASALGSLWISLGEDVVDFAGFETKAAQSIERPMLLKGLPSYSWDHDRIYWHESRTSTTFRTGHEKFHSLLGVKCPDGTDKELRWRNYLHPREVSWLAHHQVQGQMVFPAAGYISAAVEAIVQHYGLESVQLIDFHDVIIGQALVLEENAGVETVFALSITQSDADRVKATFACHSNANKGSSSMSLHASAHIVILLGTHKHDALPPRSGDQGPFLELETDRFYNTVSEIGFGYTGPFQALSGLSRKMDEAAGMITVPKVEDSEKPLIVHPGSLDGAIQSIMLAYCFPGDGRLRTLYLPTRIDRLRINPSSCVALAGPGSSLPFYSSVAEAQFAELSGDVDLYSADGRYTLVQLQGLHTTPLSPLTPADDVLLFTEITWGPEEPTGGQIVSTEGWHPGICTLSLDLERVAHFYLKTLDRSFQNLEHSKVSWYHAHQLSYIKHCVSSVASGAHPFASADWVGDTLEDITQIVSRYPDNIDMKIMRAVSERLPAVIQGEENMLEILMRDNMLSKFYAEMAGIQPYIRELARTAGQISHRYPHINLLEIGKPVHLPATGLSILIVLIQGAGSGATSEQVLSRMDKAFASYTYTDIVDTQFDELQDKFQQYQSRMAFKVLDIEKDIADQGFPDESFDVVIASLALYATKNLETTLSHVRRLLKPGGYLILLELTDPNVMRFGLTLGGLPGWWLGYDEGRMLSPCVSTDHWDALMKKTGFSGIDALTPHHSTFPLPFSIMTTQAVDTRIAFLRDPLADSQQVLGVDSLTIIGGRTILTARMAKEIENTVSHHYVKTKTVASLTDLALAELPVMGTVVSLVELDEPALKSITPVKLKAFQELFKQSKNILWLGHGAQGDNPYGNMFTGVYRTLVCEMAHLRVQFLNFYTLVDADAQTVVRRLLHLEITDIWEQGGQLNEILWYNEPEVSLQDGKALVPRFRLNSQRNDRYNSARRLIVKDVERDRSTVMIRRLGPGYQIEEKASLGSATYSDHTEVQVTKSLLRSVKVTETENLFLVVGIDPQTNDCVIALSETMESRVKIPHSWLVRCGASHEQGVRLMLGLYTHFLAQSMVNTVPPGKVLAVLDPDFSLVPILTRSATEKGVQLVLLTSKEGQSSWPWVYIHRHSTRRELLSKLPRNITRFVDVGRNDDVAAVLKQCLPSNCEIDNEQTLTSETSQSMYPSDTSRVAAQLQLAWMRTQGDFGPTNMRRFPTLGLHDLIQSPSSSTSQSLLSFDHERLPVQVLPATKQVKFSKDKTYWLVGLTGGLGLSLCQWMARQGARYIALSSRNPKIDDGWLQQMAADGCTVRIFSNDITNRDSVHATYRQICETMPPVAGVAQGAMVLQDTMFLDLDLPRLEKVLRPKVEGSLLLDELFSENTLDFLIFFSSMAAMTGNPGQVAYNAANMFMMSLAAQRRKRGLAGHAINIGAIVGNGYVTRELNMGQQSYLYRVGHSWMSEQDFHEVFAEGVLSCIERTGSAELCSGLRIDEDETKNWVSNPMFQHLVIKSSSLIAGDKKNKTGVMVKARLLDATSLDEVMETLQDGFVQKLQSALQADPSKPMLDMSPDELGVDSLVAVDLRSWFLKELGVDLPVLKIFNAASIRDLLVSATELLPQTLTPNVKTGNQPSTEPLTVSQPARPALATESTSADEEETSPVTKDGIETLRMGFLESANAYSGSSATSLKAGDSNSEENDDSATSISTDGSITVPLKRNVQKTLPMSFGQSRFWFLKFFVEDKTAFNITPTFKLTGRLRIDDFARAVEAAGQRHEALRTFFFTDEHKKHKQGVWTNSVLRLEHITVVDEKEVEEAARKMKGHVFDLAQGEIIRIQLLSLNPEQHWMIIGFHHINMDGMSFEVLWSDIEKIYQGAPLPQDVLQYPEFTLRQIREYEENAWAIDLAYWRKQFAELPPVIPLLPFSLQATRPNVSQFGAHIAHVRLDRDTYESIERCCRMFKSTPFHFHLAAWAVLLLRYLDLENVCIGLGDGNRTNADVLNSVGLFLNLLPLRFHRRSGQSFSEALKETRALAQNAFAHSRVPFDVLLTELNVPRSASHNPLFQTFFNYRQRVQESRDFCGCVAQGSLLSSGETSYDLSLDVVDIGSGERLVFLLAQKDLYAMEHAEILLNSYCNLLRSFAQNPATRVAWPALHSKKDTEEAVEIGRGPRLEHQWSETVVHRVDDIARIYHDRLALKEEGGTAFTFSQMQSQVNVIANELLNNGVGSATRVGVLQSPSANWICSLMAILRVGGTYIPLDKKVGTERLAMIAKDSQPQVILTDSTTLFDFTLLHSSAESIDVSSLCGSTASSVPNVANPAQAAVIMYTSGSTGVPKGMMISHSAYLHHAQAFSTTWDVRQGEDVILHQSSYAWDMSLYQLLISLCNGGTLVIASASTRGDPVAITDLILSEKVTCTFATPTEYLGWIRHGRSTLKQSLLQTAVCGGEFLSGGLIREFRSLDKPKLKVINVYGPAESTLACSSGAVPIDEASEPDSLCLYTLPHYSVYIVDGDLNPLPIGVPGEVVIGGAGVALGYLDQASTKKRFLPDRHASPFFKKQGWSMIHRTGDRGRITHTGGLILLGRIEGDNQIKLRGIRIDVEEIEATIARTSGGIITQAVVSSRATSELTDSDKFLVAFAIIAPEQRNPDLPAFLERLARGLPLPQYMRPAAIIPIESVPQNTSGKIDRFAVGQLSIPQAPSEEATDETLTPFEESVRGLWKEALPNEIANCFSIGAQSDFFHVGGSSLSLVNLQALIKDRLGLTVAVHRLFEASSLRGMAAQIQNVSSGPVRPVDWEEEVEPAPNFSPTPLGIDASTMPSGAGVVVLTGATGFVGKEVLRQLVEDERVTTVHCLAVRQRHVPLPAIFSDPKVSVHQGNLGAPRLGLSESAAITVFSNADVIIHNGANVSFMKSYQSLKLVNVASTEELIKLALPRRIPFHFISSASVTRLVGQEWFGEASVAPYPPPSVPHDGYTAAKWVSEVFLERVNQRFGLPVWIHRPSSVSGANAPELDLMSNVMRYTQETKKIPDSGSWSGVFDFIAVESVASQIIEAVHLSGTHGEDAKGARYLYESGEIQIGQDEVQSLMEIGTGEQFEVVPVNQWVDHAEQAGMSALLGTYLRRASEGQALLPRLVKSTTSDARE